MEQPQLDNNSGDGKCGEGELEVSDLKRQRNGLQKVASERLNNGCGSHRENCANDGTDQPLNGPVGQPLRDPKEGSYDYDDYNENNEPLNLVSVFFAHGDHSNRLGLKTCAVRGNRNDDKVLRFPIVMRSQLGQC